MGMFDDLTAQNSGAQSTGGMFSDLTPQKMAIDKFSSDAERKTNQSMTWPDVAISSVKNIPSSFSNYFGGIVNAVSHPLDTAKSIGNLAVGAGQNIAKYAIEHENKRRGMLGLPKVDSIAAKYVMNGDTPEMTLANNVGQMYKNRYGGMDEIKNTLSNDPIGFLSDVSMVSGIGAGALGSAGKLLNSPNAISIGSGLDKISKITNPTNMAISVTKPIVKGASTIGKNILGLTSGVGAENIENAAKAGFNGQTQFMDNLSGKANIRDVIDMAKQNIQKMGIEKSNDYKNGMSLVSKDTSILNFDGIDNALKDAFNSVLYKGQVKNAKGAETAQEIADEVNKWKGLTPSEFHTPEGLDALKQKIGGILEKIPDNERTASKVANDVYRAIKNEIVNQAPVYEKTMKDYADATDLIREIEKTLSLGKNSLPDTSIRKLQSLTRNNVNTNYGNRLKLAQTLQDSGGVDLLPALSGQAMNSWGARGLAGQAENMATLGAAFLHNPLLMTLLPIQSPKAIGASLYGAGKTARKVSDMANKIPFVNDNPGTLANMLYQSDLLNRNQ